MEKYDMKILQEKLRQMKIEAGIIPPEENINEKESIDKKIEDEKS